MVIGSGTSLNARQAATLANEINSRPVLRSVRVAPLEGDRKAAEVTFENEAGRWPRQVECFRLGPRGAFGRISILREAR